MNQPVAYLFVAMRPATNLPPGAADSRAAYLSGATAAMQRLGTAMTVLASTASVQAVTGADPAQVAERAGNSVARPAARLVTLHRRPRQDRPVARKISIVAPN